MQPTMPPVTGPSAERKGEHSKLVSLLALAAGAAAMPQTSQADIIFSDQGLAVSWDGNHSFVINNLPGNAQLGFQAHKAGAFSSTSTRWVTLGKQGSGYVKFKTYLVSQGFRWGDIPALVLSAAQLATAQEYRHSADDFNNLYLSFEFKDSTLVGNPIRYGWAELSLANGNLSTLNDFPKLTISSWAYDTTGAQLRTGVVPEPSSMAIIALGALTLGAAGVRSWRRNRVASGRS